MRKQGFALVASLLLLIGAGALFAAGTAESTDQTYELTIASLEPVGAPQTDAVQYMAKLVEERSAGRLTINVNPGGVLGTGLQIMEGVSIGTIDMASMVLEWYAPFVKDINVYVMGFTFRDGEHFKAFLNSPIFEQMKQQALTSMGIDIIAANWISLPRVMVSKKPVKIPADITNIKMRIPEIETYLKVWSGLGTSPTRVAWPEVYLALKTGTVDAAEGPLDQIYATKFYEAAPYITMTNHLQQVFTVGINEEIYQTLPADLRDILKQAALEAGNYYQELTVTRFSADKEKMITEGAKFNEVDTRPFQELLRPVIEELEATEFWTPGLYQKIQGL